MASSIHPATVRMGIGLEGPDRVPLKPLIDILLTQNTHDFHGAANDTVVDAVHATNTTPVARTYVVNSLVRVRLRCQLLETFEERIEVSVCLSFAILVKPASVDSLKIRFCVFADPVAHHCAAFLP